MLKRNFELRTMARVSLSGQWFTAALVTLIYVLIAGGCGAIPFVGSLLSFLIVAPLVYGYNVIFLELHRENKPMELARLFDGFNDFGRIGGTMILSQIYIVLWMFLLIIPGIVKSYSYALTPYILKDHPELKFNAAIEESMRMMNGYKMKLFLLDLSFIGWALLTILTFGIGILFLEPYVSASRAAFYEDLKAELSESLKEEA